MKVEIRKVGTLRSCQAWYAFPVDRSDPQYGPLAGSRSRTRAEAREWADKHGLRWR